MKIIDNFLTNQTNNKVPDIYANTICIDLDGVVHKYSKGFHDGTLYDEPTEGCKEALEYLSSKYRLVCWTARLNDKFSKAGKEDIIEWLKKYDLLKYFDDITGIKIPAKAYIDDNAIRHISWNNTLSKLRDINT